MYYTVLFFPASISHLVEKFPTSILNQWTYHSRLYAAAKYIADQPDKDWNPISYVPPSPPKVMNL